MEHDLVSLREEKNRQYFSERSLKIFAEKGGINKSTEMKKCFYFYFDLENFRVGRARSPDY